MKHGISFGALSAVIDEQGANLCSFKVSGKEYLWNFEIEDNQHMTTNIFPFFGALTAAAQRQYNTRTKMGENGIIAGVNFCVEDKGQDYIQLSFRSNNVTRQHYPFDFLYCIEYRIIGTRLAVNYEIQNHSERDMFFTCAYALCLELPLDDGLTGYDYDVEFLYDSSPERVELSQEGYAVRRSPYELLYGHKLRLNSNFPANEDIVLDGLPPRIAVLSPKGGNIFKARSQKSKYVRFNLIKQNERTGIYINMATTLPPKDKKEKITDLDDIIMLPKNESCFMECSYIIE